MKVSLNTVFGPLIELQLDGLRLGDGVLSLRAEGRRAQFLEVPPGIDVVVR